MSAPQKLPRWAELGLLPLINLAAALLPDVSARGASPTPLWPSAPTRGASRDPRWHLIVNADVELDEL